MHGIVARSTFRSRARSSDHRRPSRGEDEYTYAEESEEEAPLEERHIEPEEPPKREVKQEERGHERPPEPLEPPRNHRDHQGQKEEKEEVRQKERWRQTPEALP